MKLYHITAFGRRVARSVSAPDNAFWKVIRYLDKVGVASDDQVADATGLTAARVRTVAGTLKRKRILEEG